MQFILYKIEINHWVAGSLLVFFSGLFFLIGWFGLLKTNNPLTRYNPFSINRQWKGNTDKEAYLEMFHQDKPTSEDYSEQKIKMRKKKIRDILDK